MSRAPLVMHICGGGAAIGGVRQHLWCLLPHLQRLGLSAEVVFLGEGPALDETRRRGISATAVPKRGRGDLFVIARLARLMRRRRPEIVHTHTLSTNFYGRFAAVLARIPRCVTTVHSFMGDLLRHDPTGRVGNRLLFWQNQFMNRYVDRLIAVSQGVEDWLLAGGVSADRIHLIRCGIDIDAPSDPPAEARRCLELDRADWVIGNVARMHPVKDQITLLEAAVPLMRNSSSVKLVIVGEGPERPRLQARARAAGVEEQVRLPGRVSDARTLMPAFDVYVLSSKMEGIPLSVLEAMAARRPVVATRVGGVPEVVEDGVSGLLVPPASPRQLAEAIGRVRSGPRLARGLGSAGRLRVEETYDASKTSREVAELYRELIGDPRPAAAESAGVVE